MALLLNIETATEVCSTSLSSDGKIIGLKESFDDRSHASLLTVFINELFADAGTDASQLDAISVSQGPGSYTGLRIGVSVAKGICYAKNIPLIAVDTLQVMALMASEKINTAYHLLCPMIDARRMEVYSALFNPDLTLRRDTIAEIIDENSFTEILTNQTIAFFGNGAEKCTELIARKNALFIENIYPSAKYMAPIAHKAFDEKQFRDVAYFEPFYLKDFVATIPKRKVF